MSCAWWVWRSEKDYESLIDVINRIMAGDETWKGFIKSSSDLLRKSYDNVEKFCGLDLTEPKEKLKDAEWNLERENWMDAKWHLLFSTWHMLDDIKSRVEKEGSPIA